jgi:hypothetical protein
MAASPSRVRSYRVRPVRLFAVPVSVALLPLTVALPVALSLLARAVVLEEVVHPERALLVAVEQADVDEHADDAGALLRVR